MSELKFTKTHEWVRETGNGTFQVGISDFAQKELGDLVFINLPVVGDPVTKGESFGDLESVKAVSDVYSPVTGEVTAINEELLDAPEKINEDAENTWMIEVGSVTETDELLTAEEYAQFCQEQ
ncbi:MAG: glycine cleavage system protein GcvH [Erysipelotrichaceae bacterium]|nr:glycine cleavage system protein GcvH [Erysipelotrichaceae bacterium]